jgi:hypothetical protein
MRGPISIAVTGLIGLTTEAVAAYKEKKHGPGVPDSDDEEQAWMCDDVQDQLDPVDENNTGVKSDSGSVFDPDSMPPPSFSQVTGRLPAVVIIPQRRPQSKTRGFVRAYAPDLDNCGIDQQVFIRFLEGFDGAIKVRPWFAINNEDRVLTGPSLRNKASFSLQTSLSLEGCSPAQCCWVITRWWISQESWSMRP